MTDPLSERLDDAWRKLYADGDEHDVCDTIAEAAELARRVEVAQVGRVDMVCASDAVVVDELDRPVSINKKRVRLVPEPPEVG